MVLYNKLVKTQEAFQNADVKFLKYFKTIVRDLK